MLFDPARGQHITQPELEGSPTDWGGWGGMWDLNPRLPEPQSGALPTELIPPQGTFPWYQGGASGANARDNSFRKNFARTFQRSLLPGTSAAGRPPWRRAPRRYNVRDGYGIPIPSARRRRNTRFLSSLRTGNWLAKSATWKLAVNPIPVSPNPGSKATAGAGSPSIPGTSPAACVSTSASTFSTASGSHSYPTVTAKLADMRFSGR